MLRYAITDRAGYAGDETARWQALIAQAERLARAGVDYLQLREKDLAPPDLLHLARTLRDILRSGGSRTRLLVNGPLQIARDAGADGVHLSASAEAGATVAAQARSQGMIVSLSCHTIEEVERGKTFADLILFAPVFGKSVGGDEVVGAAGLEALAGACHAARPIPVLALGGITEANAPECMAAGAAGVAGIRLFR